MEKQIQTWKRTGTYCSPADAAAETARVQQIADASVLAIVLPWLAGDRDPANIATAAQAAVRSPEGLRKHIASALGLPMTLVPISKAYVARVATHVRDAEIQLDKDGFVLLGKLRESVTSAIREANGRKASETKQDRLPTLNKERKALLRKVHQWLAETDVETATAKINVLIDVKEVKLTKTKAA